MSHIADFVHRQNSVAQYDGPHDTKPSRSKSKNGTLDHLKVNVPDPSSSHMQGGSGRRKSNRLQSQAGHQMVPDNGMFGGTDASNADRTSGAGTEQFPNQGVEPWTTYDQQNTPPQQDFRDRRMSGDSYPATTSGHPSEVDGASSHRLQQTSGPHVHSMQAFPPSLPHAGQAKDRVATNGTTTPCAAQAQSSHVVDIAAHYAFAPGPSRTPAVRSVQHAQHGQPIQPPQHDPRAQTQAQAHSQAKQHQQRQHAPQVQPAAQRTRHDQSAGKQLHTEATPYGRAVNMGIYADSLDKPSPRREPDVPHKTVADRHCTPEVQQTRPLPVNEHLNHNSHIDGTGPEHPDSDMPAGSNDPHSESYLQNGIDDDNLREVQDGQTAQLSQAQPRQREHSPDLDILPPELFQKDYADVKAQPFDVDPYSRPFDFPRDKPTNTLEEQLEAVMPLQSQAQVNFLTNLTTEQWEAAGDWFIERFGDLVRKLKDSRKEKRKAARAFEDEVEQRHEAVTKKQKLTVSALSEMKENGGKVLQGTPKKPQKTKK